MERRCRCCPHSSCFCAQPPHGGHARSDSRHDCCGNVKSLPGWDGQQGPNSRGKAGSNLLAVPESPGSRKDPPCRSQGSQGVFRLINSVKISPKNPQTNQTTSPSPCPDLLCGVGIAELFPSSPRFLPVECSSKCVFWHFTSLGRCGNKSQ